MLSRFHLGHGTGSLTGDLKSSLLVAAATPPFNLPAFARLPGTPSQVRGSGIAIADVSEVAWTPTSWRVAGGAIVVVV
jgi:hypothetical protein